MSQIKISSQRIGEIMDAYEGFRKELERLHSEGERKEECIGWPECDCRLAEQIRGLVGVEDEWEYRGKNL